MLIQEAAEVVRLFCVQTELTTTPCISYPWHFHTAGIIRVDVSLDEGRSWITASLEEGNEQPLHRAWAWTLFECEVPEEELQRAAELARQEGRGLRVMSKATDASHNTQPETLRHVWNLRGINNNACHHVELEPQEHVKSGAE